MLYSSGSDFIQCINQEVHRKKTLVLGNLQTPAVCDGLDETLSRLRAWPRWIQRCQDLSMMCPDGTVLAKTLTAVTSKYIAEQGDAQFRTAAEVYFANRWTTNAGRREAIPLASPG